MLSQRVGLSKEVVSPRPVLTRCFLWRTTTFIIKSDAGSLNIPLTSSNGRTQTESIVTDHHQCESVGNYQSFFSTPVDLEYALVHVLFSPCLTFAHTGTEATYPTKIILDGTHGLQFQSEISVRLWPEKVSRIRIKH